MEKPEQKQTQEAKMKSDVHEFLGKLNDIRIAIDVAGAIPVDSSTRWAREKVSCLVHSLFFEAEIMHKKLLKEGYYTDC